MDQTVPTLHIPAMLGTETQNFNQSYMSTGMQWTSESKNRIEPQSAYTQSLISQTERKRGSVYANGMAESMYG